MIPFDEGYAASYDTVYRDKDYGGECKIFAELIRQYGEGEFRRLLNLGCGTGRHDVAYQEMGFQVLGVDRSPSMLSRARAAAKSYGDTINYLEGDARQFRCTQHFDATVMMFNVLGYMARTQDVLDALATARHHTRTGGLLIADAWYGPAVLRDGPKKQFREYASADERILRFSSGSLNTFEQTTEIDLRVLRIAGTQVVADVREKHIMRYFFPAEIELALRLSGFRLLVLRGFPNIDEPVSDGRWLFVLVAVAEPNNVQNRS